MLCTALDGRAASDLRDERTRNDGGCTPRRWGAAVRANSFAAPRVDAAVIAVPSPCDFSLGSQASILSTTSTGAFLAHRFLSLRRATPSRSYSDAQFVTGDVNG